MSFVVEEVSSDSLAPLAEPGCSLLGGGPECSSPEFGCSTGEAGSFKTDGVPGKRMPKDECSSSSGLEEIFRTRN